MFEDLIDDIACKHSILVGMLPLATHTHIFSCSIIIYVYRVLYREVNLMINTATSRGHAL